MRSTAREIKVVQHAPSVGLVQSLIVSSVKSDRDVETSTNNCSKSQKHQINQISMLIGSRFELWTSYSLAEQPARYTWTHIVSGPYPWEGTSHRTLRMQMLNKRVKYFFSTWILKILFFGAWVLICIIDDTFILVNDQINISVKFFVQKLTAHYVTVI